MIRSLITLLSIVVSLSATVINVPADQNTIQAGIDAAVDGDTVLVAPGTYAESISINKVLSIIGSGGADLTTIDTDSLDGFTIEADNPGKINGFTIQNCNVGISINQSGYYEVTNCVLKNNTTGILSRARTKLLIANNLFVHNNIGLHQDYYGITSNVENCTFFDNATYDVLWAPYWTEEQLFINNSILHGNLAAQDGTPVYLNYCRYEPGTIGNFVVINQGNITGNALFVDTSVDNFQLQDASPCIDAGNPSPLSNDSDGSRNDMGFTGGNSVFVNHNFFDFDYVALNNIKTLEFIIQNRSDSTLTINSLTSSNTQFTILNQAPIVILSGSTQNIQFIYSPTEAGQITGTVTFDLHGIAGSSTADIAVLGYGIEYYGGSINVPQVAPTIQAAIDVIATFDTVFVAPGLYEENVRLNQKSPVIIGVSGADNTIVSAVFNINNVPGNAFYVNGGGGELHGLSITNANKAVAIYFDNNYPIISECKIYSNSIAIDFQNGAGVKIKGSSIYNNDIGYFQYYYGGNAEITNSTFDNIQDIRFEPSYGTTVELNIQNSILMGPISGHDTNPVNISYSYYDPLLAGLNVQEGIENLSDLPLFADQSNSNYNLQVLSPCINTGNPDLDGDGESWSVDQDDQDPDGSRLDIGANYLHHTNVWLEDSEYFAGDTVLIPIMVEFAPDSSYSSASLQLSGYYNYVEFLGLVTESSLTSEGWTYQLNESDTSLIIWLAGSNNISGAGELLYLSFSIPDTANGIIPLNIDTAVFDEGFYPTILSSGVTSIYYIDYGDVSQNGEISPFDASLILKHLVGVEELDRHQLYNADVTLDNTVSALDASFILQYGVNLIDTLPHPEPAYALGDIQMNDEEYEIGTDISIPLHISNGSNILSFEGAIEFDPNYLVYQDIVWSELLDGFAIEISVEENKIHFAGAGSAPDGEAGIFGTINFTPHEGFVNNQTIVSLASLRWNEGETQSDVASAAIMSVVGIENEVGLPELFILDQNFPNPFNPSTTLRYGLPEDSEVSLVIYDIRGNTVRTIDSGEQAAGWYEHIWNGMNDEGQPVSTGLYLTRLRAGSYTKTIKMLYLK